MYKTPGRRSTLPSSLVCRCSQHQSREIEHYPLDAGKMMTMHKKKPGRFEGILTEDMRRIGEAELGLIACVPAMQLNSATGSSPDARSNSLAGPD